MTDPRVNSILSLPLVLKTTGSAFERFIRDEYTTLAEVNDRIFSTSIDISYSFSPLSIPKPQDDRKLEFRAEGDVFESLKDGSIAERVRKLSLEVFATDESASVQVRWRKERLEEKLTLNRRRCTRWLIGLYQRTPISPA